MPAIFDPLSADSPSRGRTGRRRALAALGCLAAGYVAARAIPGVPATGWAGGACAALSLAGLSGGRRAISLLAVAAALCGASWFAVRVLERPKGSLAAWLDHGPVPLHVRGVALTPSRVDPPVANTSWFFDGPRTTFDLRVGAVIEDTGRETRVRGVVRVRVTGTPRITAGDHVSVTALLTGLSPPDNPGEADARLWGAQQGRAGTARVASPELIMTLAPSGSILARAERTWLRARASLRERAESLLLGPRPENGPDAGRALLASLILGLREPGGEELQPAFTRLGLAHVLAISGFHLAVMAGVAMALVRCAGDLGRIEPMIVSLLVLGYLTIVPAEAPVLRSGLMVLGVLGAAALGRRYDRIALLAWIGVVLLLWRPMDLWSLGMQLSFGLVAALLWMGPRTHVRLWGVRLRTDLPRRRRWWWLEAVGDTAKGAVSASVLCWAVATPLVLHHTGMFSPLAVLSGLVVVPFTVLLLWGAYAAMIVGLAVPALAAGAAPVLGWLAGVTSWLVTGLDSLPGMWVRLPGVSWAWAAAAIVVVVHWFRRGHRRDRWAWGATLGIAAWLGVEVGVGPRLGERTVLRIDTLAVGDATCHLLRSGCEAMLWDCGASSPAAGRLMIPRAVREVGGWRVPHAIVTHANMDHYSALADAGALLGLRRLVVGAPFLHEAERTPQGPAAECLSRLRSAGVAVRTTARGETLRLGRVTLEFLAPPPDAPWPGANNHSLVALVRAPTAAGERRLLLTGDIQAEAMEWLLDHQPGLRAEVMELPHHGSANEAAYSFVAAVNPRVVLQSTGPSRAGDPRWDHARPGRIWYTTATDGASWVEFRSDGGIRHGCLR